MKPVHPERLLHAIDKVKSLAVIKAITLPAEAFQQKDEASFFINDKNTFLRIPYAEVLYTESPGDFVNIYLKSGEKKIALVSMKNLEQQLPQQLFLRISRSYLVNVQKVAAVDIDAVHLGKMQLLIGETYTDIVMNTIVGNMPLSVLFEVSFNLT